MAKAYRLSELRFGQTEVHSSTQLDPAVLQCYLVDIYIASLYQGNRLPYRPHSVFSSYRHQARFQCYKEQHPYTAAV